MEQFNSSQQVLSIFHEVEVRLQLTAQTWLHKLENVRLSPDERGKESLCCLSDVFAVCLHLCEDKVTLPQWILLANSEGKVI